MKLRTGLLVALGMGFAFTASASTLTDNRGFLNCESEFMDLLGESGLVLKHNFEVADRGSSKTFYVKGSAWADDGSRTIVTGTCVTERFGRVVSSIDIDSEKSISRAGNLTVR
ncbi:MAG: hypothetical protein IIA75_06640 [Proteobacteria bacterium]|nr:hypothetical protein [Pseudomonadota bacterium]